MVDMLRSVRLNAKRKELLEKYLLSQPQPSTNQQAENYYISATLLL